MSHTTPTTEQMQPPACSCNILESIPYLDTSCQIKGGKVITDLYRKPSDRNQYLLNSSCHPAECLNSIPYSLATRITRICMEELTRDKRLSELREMLLEGEYPRGVIDAAITKAWAIPRQQALRRVSRPPANNRPVFVVSFDPRLPSLSKIAKKHWRSMVTEEK